MLCYNCMSKIKESDSECPFCGSKVGQESASHHLRPGTVLQDRYIVGNSLGEGGFGITYIGFDQKLKMRVAIKEFYPYGYVNRNNTISAAIGENSSQDKKDLFEKGKEKFTNEAQVLAKFCGKPGVVAVRDLFNENNTAYIVMEYLDGITLKEYIKENGGKIPPQKAIALLMPVINSLSEIHKHDIIHRDISPDNIMINNNEAKLLDFGSARAFSNAGSQSLSIMLKHGYAPIEQYSTRGKQGPWTDVYGLCATIYKCVTGNTPDDAVDRQISDRIKPPSALGVKIEKGFEYALMKGMSVQYTDRFQSIDEMLDGFNGKKETVHITKNKPQNEDDVKTELLFKPDSASSTTDSKKNEPLIVLAANTDVPQKTVAVINSIKERNTVKPNKHKKKFKLIFSLCAVCTLLILAVIIIPKLVKQESVKTPESVGSSEAVDTPVIVETTVNILGNKYDIATTTELNLSYKGIDDDRLKQIIPQIKKLTNLRFLSLMGNQISDITLLAKLTNLTELNLHKNQISDITPLAKLTDLTKLDLYDNKISDITPLAQLTNLTELDLYGNQISDITPLAKLTNLTELNLWGNQISDITPLAKLTNLTELKLSYNVISDITPLAKLTNLTKLNLGSNKISDIVPLAKLTNLTELNLGSNTISDIVPLAKLTNLTELNLGSNTISAIVPLAKLTNLTKLDLYGNQISDIKLLVQLTNLIELDLGSNKISDITPLAKLTNLTMLDLKSNKISDITPLAKLTNLTDLNLEYNSISNITLLAKLSNLTKLNLMWNKIIDIKPLAKLTNMTDLYLWGNKISDNDIKSLKEQLQNCNIQA